MATKPKMNLKLNIREIDLGFIATLGIQNDVEIYEMWCEDRDSIIDQIRNWIHEIFIKRSESYDNNQRRENQRYKA